MSRLLSSVTTESFNNSEISVKTHEHVHEHCQLLVITMTMGIFISLNYYAINNSGHLSETFYSKLPKQLKSEQQPLTALLVISF